MIGKNEKYTRDSDHRTPINVHPDVVDRLARMLMRHPRLGGTGIGYSEFIADAIDAFDERQEWAPERALPIVEPYTVEQQP